MSELNTYCYWPDGDYTIKESICEYNQKSDDYREMGIPVSVEEDEVHAYIKEHAHEYDFQ